MFKSCPFVKTYIHKYVVRDIKAALVHFKDLEPVTDKYGKNKNTREILHVKLEKSL